MYRTLNPGNRVRLPGAVRSTRSDVVQRKGARLLPGRLGFESLRRSQGLVAQLGRAPALQAEACRFESDRVHVGLRSSEEERRRAKPEVAGSTPAGGTSYDQLV